MLLFVWGNDSLGLDGPAKNNEADKQHESEQPDRVLHWEFAWSGEADTAKGISHAPKVANIRQWLLVKSRQIARAGTAKELFRRGIREEPEVVHHMRLIAVAGLKGDLRKGLPGIP